MSRVLWRGMVAFNVGLVHLGLAVFLYNIEPET